MGLFDFTGKAQRDTKMVNEIKTREELFELVKKSKGYSFRVYVKAFDAFMDVSKKELLFTLEKWAGPKCGKTFIVSETVDDYWRIIRIQHNYLEG